MTLKERKEDFYRPSEYYMDTTSDEVAVENEYPHRMKAVSTGEKSKDAKLIMLLTKEKTVF